MCHFYGATPINGSMAVYDGHTIDYHIDRWDEFAKNLKDGKAPVFNDLIQSMLKEQFAF